MQSRTFPVGTSPQQILGPGAYGALLQADPGNTADIYIGGDGVTANAAETGGVRLSPGGALAVKVNAAEYLFVVSSSAGQNLRVLLGDQEEWIAFELAGSLVQGLGVADTPAGGVMTIQGTGSGGILPIATSNPPSSIDGLSSYGLLLHSSAFAAGVLAVGCTVYDGVARLVRTQSTRKTLAAVAVTAGTPVSIWTPAVGKSFRLMGWNLSLSVAGSIIFQDGPAGGPYTEIWRTPTLVANTPDPVPPNWGNGILSAAINNQLWIDVTATGTVMGGVFGTEE